MPRADKRKNVDKVVAELVKNPLATETEIANSIGVNQSTVNRAKGKVHETAYKDDRIVSLTTKDWEIQELIQDKKLDKLRTKPDEISDSDLNQWDRHSMTRYTTLKGELTDSEGGMKNQDIKLVKGLTEEEVDARLLEILNS